MNNGNGMLNMVVPQLPGYEHMDLIDARGEDARIGAMYTREEIAEKKIYGNVTSTLRKCEDGKLRYVMDKLSHAVIVGTTGSGKSTGPIAAQMDAASLAGYSFGVIDTKGELYASTAARLKELGYRTLVINMKDAWHSEKFNPLQKAAKKILTLKDVGVGIEVKTENGKECYEYKGVTYYSNEELRTAFSYEIKDIYEKAQEDIRGLVAKLWPIESQKDPFWERAAWQMLVGIAFALATDQLDPDPERRTTLEQVNFANMKAIFNSFENSGRSGLNDRGFFKRRGYDSFCNSEVKRIFFENAETTMRNYIGFVDAAFKKYNFSGFNEFTLTTTFDMKDIVEKPTAVFLVYDEMDVLCKSFLSYIISYMLEELKLIADSTPELSLPKPFLFIADEFATLPKNESIANFIAFGRSRKIFIHFVLQSYSQLYETYGDSAKSFLENCATTIFLSTNDHRTIQDFSVELGKTTIVSPGSDINKGYIHLEERPLVTCSELSVLQQGEVYVKRHGQMPLKGCFEKSYEVPEYSCVREKLSDYPNPLAANRSDYDYDVTKIHLDNDYDDDDDLF